MDQLTALYSQKIKQYLVPLVLVVVSAAILIYITIPQFNSIADLQQEINTKKIQVQDSRETRDALSALPETELGNDLRVANRALPTSKDIVSIYSALSTAALQSQVTIRAFSIKVGGIFSSQQEILSSTEKSQSGTPLISIRLNVSADDYQGLISFAENLYKVLPLSDVNTISTSKDQATFDVNFYYKPVDTKQLVKQELVRPLSVREQNVLNTISEWD